MNTETETATGSDMNGKESPDPTTEPEIFFIEKFDKQKFLIISISGIVCSVIGVVVISSSMNVPDKFAASPGIHTIRNIIADSPKDLLIFLAGNLILLAGVYCIFLGLKIVVRHIAGRPQD
jgi:hypothetical protein